MLARLALVVIVLLVPLRASAETPVADAQALISRYDEDLTAIDRARHPLEDALKRESQVETIIMLSYVSVLGGYVRATPPDAPLASRPRRLELPKRAQH